MKPIASAAAFQVAFDVSRETMDRLTVFEALLLRWSHRINLVSRHSLPQRWRRHFADSAQLWRYCPSGAKLWLDIGSGAGFPGMVIAAIAVEQRPGLQVILAESNLRKAAFLAEAARACQLPVAVTGARIEACAAQGADVISARALAPLDRLIDLAKKHRAPGGICLFLKGEAVHNELARAHAVWRFAHRLHPSVTDPRAAVVEIGAIADEGRSA